MRVIRNWILAALVLLPGELPGAIADFMEIAPTPKGTWCGGSPRSGADAMDGLWFNPAHLGSLEKPLSFQVAVNLHLGTTLLTGGIALKRGAFSLGIGASGLFLGNGPGDLQFAGDSGRFVPAGSIRGSAVLAWAPSEAPAWPLHWTLAAGFMTASETLDQAKLGAQYLSAGTDLRVPIGPRVNLSLSLGVRGLLPAPKGVTEASLLGSAALTGEFQISKSVDLAAIVEGLYTGSSAGLNLGLEARFLHRFYVRAGTRFEANPSFTLGGGVLFILPGPGSLGVDLAGLPGRAGFESAMQVFYAP